MAQMRLLLLLLVLMLGPGSLALGQAGRADLPTIDPENVRIVRDTFGVPHIFAPTDEEAAYGLAYAQCEDMFEQVQKQLLMVSGTQGERKGIDGALQDYYLAYIRAEEMVDTAYQHISPKARRVLKAFAMGINTYAMRHQEDWQAEGLFPINDRQILMNSVMTLSGMTGLPNALKTIHEGHPEDYVFPPRFGSNAFAFAPSKTASGQTVVVCNPHLGMRGTHSFYEFDLQTEEGWNVHGACFPGMPMMAMGATPHHAWGITFNWPDYIDIYELEVHPDDEFKYRYDGEWREMEHRKIKLKVKIPWLLGLKIPVKRELLWTAYGPALRTNEGVYATAFPRLNLPRALETWYRMNKATSLQEFQDALAIRGLPLFNIVYGDREGNIFYQFNGSVPKRNPHYDWQSVLPGDTSATQWQGYYPLEELPRYTNPDCGYLYNTNNTPFHATCPAENLDPAEYDTTSGYDWSIENNRDLRVQHHLYGSGKLSMADIRALKFDNTYSKEGAVYDSVMSKWMTWDPAERPGRFTEAIEHLQAWNLSSDTANRHAALALLTAYFVYEEREGSFGSVEHGLHVEEKLLWKSFKKARRHLKRRFGTVDVPWGRVQRHERGKVSLPIDGMPEVPRAMYTTYKDKAHFRVSTGDTYVALMAFDDDSLASLKTIVPYGSSAVQGSAHYTDQMERFATHRFKEMTMEREAIEAKAESSYSPPPPDPAWRGH